MSDVSKPRETDQMRKAALREQSALSEKRLGGVKDYDPLAEAQSGIDEHLDHYTKAQGRAAEKSVLEKMRAQGETVTDLNTRFDPSFPIYDVTSDKQVASVKCRGLDQGATPSQALVKKYISDLEDATGNVTDPSRFTDAVNRLHADARAGQPGYPAELAASPHQAEKYLRENAKLMIPDDHVAPVKTELARRLFGDDLMSRQTAANRLGLGEINAPDYMARANAMLDRIQGVGVSSTQIKQLLKQSPGIWND